jgi:hypothetical protein
VPEGKTLVAGGRLWRISYTGALTGHDIVLTGEERVITCDHIQHASNGLVTVTGSADPNRTLILETTADFEQFTVLGNALPRVNGVWTFTDTTAPALPHRFYRARYQ